jgi:hypothetical protein
VRIEERSLHFEKEQQEQAKTAGHGTFISLRFAVGEAFQFDLNEDWAVINRKRSKLQIPQLKFGHSRVFFVRA